MKKITLLMFAFGAMSLASCKKTRTCTCTGTTTTVTTTTDDATGFVIDTSTDSSPEAYTNQLSKTTKAAAKGTAECMSRTESFSYDYSAGGNTVESKVSSDITCKIK